MAQNSHVPKFGNWETDNVPYTAYFENARREKAGIMMNPNDPMQNPEAFKTCTEAGENKSCLEKGSQTRSHLHHRVRGSQGSFTAEFASERSHCDNSVIHTGPQTDKKRSITKRGSIISSSSSSSHSRHRSGSSSFNDHKNHEATAIPKFGSWDVTDPKSGEGYTIIFNKIKEEREIASSIKTPPLHNCSNFKNQYDGNSFRLSKLY